MISYDYDRLIYRQTYVSLNSSDYISSYITMLTIVLSLSDVPAANRLRRAHKYSVRYIFFFFVKALSEIINYYCLRSNIVS